MKKIVSIIVFIVVGTAISISQDIYSVFPSIPSSILLGLEIEQKGMLLTNVHDSLPMTTRNAFGAEVKRLAINTDFLSLQTSKAGTIQIKLLPLINGSKVICVVRTVCAQMCDSQVEFYTDKWESLPKAGLMAGMNMAWFLKEDIDQASQDFKNAYAIVDIQATKISLSPSSNDMSITLDIKNYLGADEYDKLKPYLTEKSKTLTWNNFSFIE